MALGWLERWGVRPGVRSAGRNELNNDALTMAIYEAERPPAEQAYRLGDARFLNLETA